MAFNLPLCCWLLSRDMIYQVKILSVESCSQKEGNFKQKFGSMCIFSKWIQ